MLKLFSVFFLFIITASCSTVTQTDAAGSQKIQIRVWQDQSPNLLALAPNDVYTVDPLSENVVEFDTIIYNGDVYLVYTTDRSVLTSKDPNTTLPTPTGGLVDLPASETATDFVHDIQIVTDLQREEIRYRREVVSGGTSTISDYIIYNAVPKIQTGVWVRVFRAKITGSTKIPNFEWELVYASKDPLNITSPKLLPLAERPSTIVAVRDGNKVEILSDPDKDGVLNQIANSTFDGRTYSKIDNINTWNKDNKTFISLIADKNLITGFYENFSWMQTYNREVSENITGMKIAVGRDDVFATWYNQSTKQVELARYRNECTTLGRWRQLDTLNFSNFPSIASRIYTDLQGIQQEYLFLGAPNIQRSFFQLYRVNDAQTVPNGPIIVEWNERYNFAVNNLGQVLYVRVNPNQQLIFAGLNSLAEWEIIQRTNPPRALAYFDTPLQAFYLEGVYPFVVFKQLNGSIYVLGGAR